MTDISVRFFLFTFEDTFDQPISVSLKFDPEKKEFLKIAEIGSPVVSIRTFHGSKNNDIPEKKRTNNFKSFKVLLNLLCCPEMILFWVNRKIAISLYMFG